MARAYTRLTFQDATGIVRTGKTLTFFETDGATPLSTSIYKTATGSSAYGPSELVTDGEGAFEGWSNRRKRFVVTCEGDSTRDQFYPDPDDLINVRDFGALSTATAAVNRAAIQAAIDAATAAGGGSVLIPDTYHIDAAITMAGAAAAAGLAVYGYERDCSGLIQDTAGQDVLCVGGGEGKYATNMIVSRLTLSGGRYSLNLNNVLASEFSRLLLDAGVIGLYGQGQLERLFVSQLDVENPSSYGISLGNANGGTSPSQNFPEFAKSTFEQVRVSGAGGASAVRLTASVYLGNQQESGTTVFRNLRLESNPKDGVDIDFCNGLTFEAYSAEAAAALAANNTYVGFRVGGTGLVTLRDALLPGRANNGGTYKYCVEHTGGVLLIDGGNFTLAGDPATASIRVAGISATISNATVSSASQIVFANATVQAKSHLSNVLNGSGVPIVGWAVGTNWMAGTANGLAFGNVLVGDGQVKVRTYRGALGNGAVLDLGTGTLGRVRLYDASSGTLAECNVRGPGNAVDAISDPVGILATTDSGVTWAIYANGGSSYLMKNRSGALRGYVVQIEDGA